MSPDQPEVPNLSSVQDIEVVRSKLRHTEHEPAFFELTQIPPDTNLVEFLRNWLQENGYDYNAVKVRSITRDRLRLAMTTGTDRDRDSNIHHLGGHDEEELAMSAAGLNPSTDKGRVTYVTTRGLQEGQTWIIPDNPIARSNAYLIYAPAGLKQIGNASNGLHVFVDQSLIQPSLLAVLSPIPQTMVDVQKS